jgi:hypothetical protein
MGNKSLIHRILGIITACFPNPPQQNTEKRSPTFKTLDFCPDCFHNTCTMRPKIAGICFQDKMCHLLPWDFFGCRTRINTYCSMETMPAKFLAVYLNFRVWHFPFEVAIPGCLGLSALATCMAFMFQTQPLGLVVN